MADQQALLHGHVAHARPIKRGLLFRTHTPDRPLLSANDWYGLGYLEGLGVAIDAEYVHWYCGEKGARGQARLGIRDARATRETRV